MIEGLILLHCPIPPLFPPTSFSRVHEQFRVHNLPELSLRRLLLHPHRPLLLLPLELQRGGGRVVRGIGGGSLSGSLIGSRSPRQAHHHRSSYGTTAAKTATTAAAAIKTTTTTTTAGAASGTKGLKCRQPDEQQQQ